MLRVLVLGDVLSPATVAFLCRRLWSFRRENKVDFTVVNGENAGFLSGIGSKDAALLLDVMSFETNEKILDLFLGNRIEHESKRYGSIPPKDPAKWARICEHIIRHMNEGWAGGHHYGIEYWEIWNEPDVNPQCWDGPVEEF